MVVVKGWSLMKSGIGRMIVCYYDLVDNQAVEPVVADVAWKNRMGWMVDNYIEIEMVGCDVVVDVMREKMSQT